jgi:hypothetical protein
MRPTSALTTSLDDSTERNYSLSLRDPTAPDGLRLPLDGIAITWSAPEGVSCANHLLLFFIIPRSFGVFAQLNNLFFFILHCDSHRFSYKDSWPVLIASFFILLFK